MDSAFVTLTPADLSARLRNTEDPYVERKTEGDFKDVLKTAVAFANSLPPGVPGVLFMPVTDQGEVQVGHNLDRLQKKISERIAEAYPAIRYFQQILTIDQTEVIAVQIWGSPERPHFAGASFVRDGSQTKKASEQQFTELIARRSSKVEELARWTTKEITVVLLAAALTGPRIANTLTALLVECNQWYITVHYRDVMPTMPQRESFGLERVRISYDHKFQRLLLEIVDQR